MAITLSKRPSQRHQPSLAFRMATIHRQALAFAQFTDLADRLADNHATKSELWVRIYKSGSGKPSVTWTDCVVEAIRVG